MHKFAKTVEILITSLLDINIHCCKFKNRACYLCKQKFEQDMCHQMIHSARPTVSPVAIIIFCFARFEKWGRTDGQHVQK